MEMEARLSHTTLPSAVAATQQSNVHPTPPSSLITRVDVGHPGPHDVAVCGRRYATVECPPDTSFVSDNPGRRRSSRIHDVAVCGRRYATVECPPDTSFVSDNPGRRRSSRTPSASSVSANPCSYASNVVVCGPRDAAVSKCCRSPSFNSIIPALCGHKRIGPTTIHAKCQRGSPSIGSGDVTGQE